MVEVIKEILLLTMSVLSMDHALQHVSVPVFQFVRSTCYTFYRLLNSISLLIFIEF